MESPLGRAVGNANEVIESIETLKGRGPADLEALSVRLAARMLALSGVASEESDAEQRVRRALESGAGLEKFREIIAGQGGDPHVIDDYNLLPAARRQTPWTARRGGVVAKLDAELIGRAAVALGAGRDRADAGVDPAVGIDVVAPPGARVAAGDAVLVVSCDDPGRLAAAGALLADAVTIADEAPAAPPLVIDIIDGRDVRL
jgi:thymidine phosphorylase